MAIAKESEPEYEHENIVDGAGEESSAYIPEESNDEESSKSSDEESSEAESSEESNPEHSETYNQEENVLEADIVKTDGKIITMGIRLNCILRQLITECSQAPEVSL